jgi:hypothetical protein
VENDAENTYGPESHLSQWSLVITILNIEALVLFLFLRGSRRGMMPPGANLNMETHPFLILNQSTPAGELLPDTVGLVSEILQGSVKQT